MDFFHNEEDAMDVVQEVYVRMLKRGWQQGDNIEALHSVMLLVVGVILYCRQTHSIQFSVEVERIYVGHT